MKKDHAMFGKIMLALYGLSAIFSFLYFNDKGYGWMALICFVLASLILFEGRDLDA